MDHDEKPGQGIISPSGETVPEALVHNGPVRQFILGKIVIGRVYLIALIAVIPQETLKNLNKCLMRIIRKT